MGEQKRPFKLISYSWLYSLITKTRSNSCVISNPSWAVYDWEIRWLYMGTTPDGSYSHDANSP